MNKWILYLFLNIILWFIISKYNFYKKNKIYFLDLDFDILELYLWNFREEKGREKKIENVKVRRGNNLR